MGDYIDKTIRPRPGMKAAIGRPYDGMPWTLDENHPVPAGYVHHNGVLRRLSGRHVAASTVSGDVVAASREVDAMLAEAQASGMLPVRVSADVTCGQCTPCRSGLTVDCIRRGTREAWAMVQARKSYEAAQIRDRYPSLDDQLREAELDEMRQVDVWLREAGYPVHDGRSYQWAG